MRNNNLKIALAAVVLLLCTLLAGCGCGKKQTDPASEQVLKISITPEPSPTPEPSTVDSSAVETTGDITMVNTYLLEHPSAVRDNDSVSEEDEMYSDTEEDSGEE